MESIAVKTQENTKTDHHQLFARVIMALMALIMLLNFVMPANAQTLVHIQCSLDLSTWEILSAVVRDSVGVTARSPELRRVEESVLNDLAATSDTLNTSHLAALSTYVNSYGEEGYEGKAVNTTFLGGVGEAVGGIFSDEKNRVLTFPGKTGDTESSQTVDMNKAMEVNDALVYDLNNAFALWLEANNISKTPNLSEFYDSMTLFLSDLTFSGDYCRVTGVDGRFRWRIPKGYLASDHDESLKMLNADQDAEYVNWGMLVYEAFNNFVLEGDESVTSDNVYSSNPSQLTKAIVDLFGGALDSLRGILGMWSMDELLFSTGIRENGYVGGIFPKNWEPTIWALFFVMELFAAMVLMFGIINNVLKKALSTMNTIARMHAMAHIQDLIICAIALALLPLVLRIIISLSANFTAMVYAMVPTINGEPKSIADMVARYGSGSGTIGGIIAQFLFFGVQVYFNFFYALRGLTVAMLIVLAPIMVAMIAVSDSRKQSTLTWAKELLANILIQPIQAFLMMFILLLPASTHGFDNLIALYALIPFTSVLRGLFFGSAGGWADQAASKAKGKVTGALVGAGIAAGGAVIGGSMALGKGSGSGANGSSAGGGTDGTGGSGGAGDSSGGGFLGRAGNAFKNTGSAIKNSNTGQAVGRMAGAVASSPVGQTLGGAVSTVGGGLKTAGAAVSGFVAAGASRAANSDFLKNSVVKGRSTVSGVADRIRSTPQGAAALDAGQRAGEHIKNIGSGIAKDAPGAFQALGRGVKKVAPVVAGAGLSMVGGGLAGGGYGGPASNMVSSLGMKMVQGGKSSGKEGADSSGPSSQNLNTSDMGLGGDVFDAAAMMAAPNIASPGSDFVNQGVVLGDKADAPMQRYDADAAALASMGFSDVKDDYREMSWKVDPSAGGQSAELAAYADYCSTLPVADRAEAMRQTGVSATKVGDGYSVTVNKQRWSAANGGATITATRPGRNKPVNQMRVESPVGTTPALVTGMTPSIAPSQMRRSPSIGTTANYRANRNAGKPPTQAVTQARATMAEAGPQPQNYVVQSQSLSAQQRTGLDRAVAQQSAGRPVPIVGVERVSRLDNGNYDIQTAPGVQPDGLESRSYQSVMQEMTANHSAPTHVTSASAQTAPVSPVSPAAHPLSPKPASAPHVGHEASGPGFSGGASPNLIPLSELSDYFDE